MDKLDSLKDLVSRFKSNLAQYKDKKTAYNEHSCRIEYIDPFLELLGWDVPNKKGLAPQYREVIAEYHLNQNDRPDYSMTLRGVAKFFIEAKKPQVDITKLSEPAFQARKYGWNANHQIVVLTNFEYFVIYDSTYMPKEKDGLKVAVYRTYHYAEYVDKFDEINALVSRESVYSGAFDDYWGQHVAGSGSQKLKVDDVFLAQINTWRILIGNDLYSKTNRYDYEETLNDAVQEFINQIIFLRICEDKNLPLYHKLSETIDNPDALVEKLKELFIAADKRYNAGLFSGDLVFFDLAHEVIIEIVKGLYYPESPYLFNIIEPSLLGKIYEMFLTTRIILPPDYSESVTLALKDDCIDRAIVTTPVEIVKYMVDRTLSALCEGKTPEEILTIRVADIACGSGVFLDEAFLYLQNHCINWYLANAPSHLIEIGNNLFKLPLQEKKQILSSCIYGIELDIHAVEVAKFTLLIRLIENETSPSVEDTTPILPNLSNNIFHGNALIEAEDLIDIKVSPDDRLQINPFSWSTINKGNKFDAIIGNPPYVGTEEMHALLPATEFELYKNKYESAYKQFDKYFLFIERALNGLMPNGFLSYVVPNKYYKINAGKNLRGFIASRKVLVSIDDFGASQLFDEKTIYSSISIFQNKRQTQFEYARIGSREALWAGENINRATIEESVLGIDPWQLTGDHEILSLLDRLKTTSVPFEKVAKVFNGIQTSAERPVPVYWFSKADIEFENKDTFSIIRDGQHYHIEKLILKPYFKPTKKSERKLNSYSSIQTDKRVIFPYDEKGKLYPIHVMKSKFPGAYAYLEHYYDRLLPKSVSPAGKRNVPDATAETWYQYGRTQALTSFINNPKLIVGVLSKEPMYAFDDNDMLIASGGTAGYCAISAKDDHKYEIEYLQAWLSNPYTERIIASTASDFEGGFIARGTYLLSQLPFVELDFDDNKQKELYDNVVEKSKRIYEINGQLVNEIPKNTRSIREREKAELIDLIQKQIEKVYLNQWD